MTTRAYLDELEFRAAYWYGALDVDAHLPVRNGAEKEHATNLKAATITCGPLSR